MSGVEVTRHRSMDVSSGEWIGTLQWRGVFLPLAVLTALSYDTPNNTTKETLTCILIPSAVALER